MYPCLSSNSLYRPGRPWIQRSNCPFLQNAGLNKACTNRHKSLKKYISFLKTSYRDRRGDNSTNSINLVDAGRSSKCSRSSLAIHQHTDFQDQLESYKIHMLAGTHGSEEDKTHGAQKWEVLKHRKNKILPEKQCMIRLIKTCTQTELDDLWPWPHPALGRQRRWISEFEASRVYRASRTDKEILLKKQAHKKQKQGSTNLWSQHLGCKSKRITHKLPGQPNLRSEFQMIVYYTVRSCFKQTKKSTFVTF